MLPNHSNITSSQCKTIGLLICKTLFSMEQAINQEEPQLSLILEHQLLQAPERSSTRWPKLSAQENKNKSIALPSTLFQIWSSNSVWTNTFWRVLITSCKLPKEQRLFASLALSVWTYHLNLEKPSFWETVSSRPITPISMSKTHKLDSQEPNDCSKT